MHSVTQLRDILGRLRDPERGCPWDIVQTFESIVAHTIEESYEVADAIKRQAWDELEGELGDLLLQVVYHASIGDERGLFDLDSIAQCAASKMIARHPHVFGDSEPVASAAEQSVNWETQKARERGGPSLDGVALALPALLRARKLQARAARVGFDWDSGEAVCDKLAEEVAELAAARRSESQSRVHEEFGDLLFTLVNFARHLDIDAEGALRDANIKFEKRFKAMEEILEAQGVAIQEAERDQLEKVWDDVKAAEGRR